MYVHVTVPGKGESVIEMTLAAWLKEDGDYVELNEPLYELKSGRETATVPSPARGELMIKVPAGTVVRPDQVVGAIDADITRTFP